MTYQPDAETLLAVILGAALATAGGFGERQVERGIQKRERERSAALFFGELLSAMRVMMKLANESRARGEPYGPITMRFVRAVQREVEIHDRNRETLLDLRGAVIRANIGVLIARLSFSLDGVLEAHAMLAALDAAARPEQRAALQEMRNSAFEAAVDTAKEITPLLGQLAPLAQHDFGATETAVPAAFFAQPEETQGQALTPLAAAPREAEAGE